MSRKEYVTGEEGSEMRKEFDVNSVKRQVQEKEGRQERREKNSR